MAERKVRKPGTSKAKPAKAKSQSQPLSVKPAKPKTASKTARKSLLLRSQPLYALRARLKLSSWIRGLSQETG